MRRFLILTVLLLPVLAGGRGAMTAAAARPNIVLILTDDMGYSDLGCYGGEISTENLDRLAADGLRFTQFYNTARCCPTRASLLTGLHPHQTGVGHMMEDKGRDAYRGDLNRRCVTIAEALKPAGYRSYAVGKWHVTRHVKPDGPKDNWPRARGFDRYYGTLTGAGNYYDPSTLVRDDTMITAETDSDYQPKAPYYYTDAIGDHAVGFIREHGRDHPDRPFFLYVAFTAAHWPMQAPEADVARYRGRYDAGYEVVRSNRFERMRALGLLEPGWALSPPAGRWASVTNRAWEARCMEVYAAMVSRMDRNVGAILRALRKRQDWADTLVFYLQDNGGCAETVGREGGDRRAERPTLPPLDGHYFHLDSRPKQTGDGWPMLGGPAVMPGPRDTFIAYGRSWANVSNAPFREYKHWVHEGGIATPLIVSWPAAIRDPGRFRHQPGQLPDILATCLDAAGVAYPRAYDGRSILPLEGQSLRPALENRPVRRDGLYWEHEGNRAVRVGAWKLVAKGPAGPWELYDIEADRTESHDLAAAQPGRVRELATRWAAWAVRTGVLPWIWQPAYPASIRAVGPTGGAGAPPPGQSP
jgi:arylsulfatase